MLGRSVHCVMRLPGNASQIHVVACIWADGVPAYRSTLKETLMSTLIDRTAETDAPIIDILAARWSTRIFDRDSVLDEAALASALEAARWAPTAANTQAWRVIVARRGSAAHAKVLSALAGFNSAWAGDAAALVVFVAETERDGKPMRWAEYDAGQVA